MFDWFGRLLLISFTLFSPPILAAEQLDEKPTTHFLFINGGGWPESNYSIHEEDLQAFYYTLFRGKAEVLNANGKESLVLPLDDEGLVLRNELGHWKTTPSQFKGAARPANLQEVRKTFDSFKRNPRSKITAIYGDHGTEKGVSLWGGEDLSARDLHSLHASLPAETLVRSIHLHCHSNAAVLDHARKRPNSIEDWPKYLTENYRKNSCALASSGEDEVSDYLDFGKKWAQGTWNKLLEENTNPSLKSMRDSLVDVKALRGTVRLTSDNLTEDIFNFFCEQTGYVSGKSNRPPSEAHDKEGMKPRSEEAGPHGCFSDYEKKELARLDAEVEKSHRLYLQATELLRNMGQWWIEEKYPELHKAHEVARKGAEEILRDEALGKLSELEKATAKKLVTERSKEIIDKYNLILAQIALGDLNAEGFQEVSLRPEFMKWLDEGKGVKESFSEVLALYKNPQFKGKGILDVLQQANEGYDKARGERKKYYRRMQGKRRIFTESLLKARANEPEIAKIQEFYESIKRCENSPIR